MVGPVAASGFRPETGSESWELPRNQSLNSLSKVFIHDDRVEQSPVAQ